MAEEMQSLSKLRNRHAERVSEKSAPKSVDDGTKPEADEEPKDGAHEALEMAHQSEPGSKHVLVSHDGYGMTSHGIDENGQHDGPHDHENIEELKSHLGKFFDEEENEGHDDGEQGMEPMESAVNLY